MPNQAALHAMMAEADLNMAPKWTKIKPKN
jgi:hypothetical protein